jgi:hypothetical protein
MKNRDREEKMRGTLTAIILAVLAIFILTTFSAAATDPEGTIVNTALTPYTPSFVPYLTAPAASPEAAGPSATWAAAPAAPAPADASSYLRGMYGPSGFERSMFTTSLLTQVALNVADYVTTSQALKTPGLAEGNPVMKPFVKNPYIFAAVKAGFTALSYYSLKGLYKKSKTTAWALSILSNFALSYVVANNMSSINKARAK